MSTSNRSGDGSEQPLTAKAKTVLEAATKVFLEHGFSASTTDMIQQQAGVSKATVYKHFGSKEGLFSAMVKHECDSFTGSLQSIFESGSELTSTLETLGQRYLQILLSPRRLALYRVVVSEAPRFPELGKNFYQTGPMVTRTLLAEYLGQAASKGEIDIQQVGADGAAGMLLSMLRGETQQECLTHPDSHPSEVFIQQHSHRAVDAFLKAFRPV